MTVVPFSRYQSNLL